MSLYESLSITIAAIALGVNIWAHIRINKTNTKIKQNNVMIQDIQKLSTSGGQSPVVSGDAANVTINYGHADTSS